MKNVAALSIACASVAAVFIALLIYPEEAIARAGGGRSKGGGILGLILWPVFAIYSAIITYYAVKKYKEAKLLLARIAADDGAWDIDAIKQRIEEAYFAIQYAWRDRDPGAAEKFMSDRLYSNHSIQLQDMVRRKIRNEMRAIALNSVKVLEVLDYNDDSKDRFVALIEGSMIDYLVNESGQKIDGDDANRSFKELWKFKRETHGWVLDEIDSDVSISDVRDMQAWSESHGTGA